MRYPMSEEFILTVEEQEKSYYIGYVAATGSQYTQSTREVYARRTLAEAEFLKVVDWLFGWCDKHKENKITMRFQCLACLGELRAKTDEIREHLPATHY